MIVVLRVVVASSYYARTGCAYVQDMYKVSSQTRASIY